VSVEEEDPLTVLDVAGGCGIVCHASILDGATDAPPLGFASRREPPQALGEIRVA
jgi:hypothetical protein